MSLPISPWAVVGGFVDSSFVNPVSKSEVINVLVDFNQKMEELLNNMRNLFEGFEAIQALPLEMVPNITMDTREIPSLKAWEVGV